MNDRLLTDYKLYFRGFNLHIRDIIKKHIFGDITKAQDAETLKEAGEWLEGYYQGPPIHWWVAGNGKDESLIDIYGKGDKDRVIIIPEEIIKKLKRGEMPMGNRED